MTWDLCSQSTAPEVPSKSVPGPTARHLFPGHQTPPRGIPLTLDLSLPKAESAPGSPGSKSATRSRNLTGPDAGAGAATATEAGLDFKNDASKASSGVSWGDEARAQQSSAAKAKGLSPALLRLRLEERKSVKVSSPLEDVVMVLRGLLAEEPLSENARAELEFALSTVLSSNLYAPTVVNPSFSPKDGRSSRRATLAASAPQLDKETESWLSKDYRLDKFRSPSQLGGAASLPNTLTRAVQRTTFNRSFTQGNRLREEVQRLAEASTQLAQRDPYENDPRVLEVLKKRHDVDFDVFELGAVDGGGALKSLATALLEDLGICEKLGVPKATLLAFLTGIERGYLPVAYHSSLHAADVLHSTYRVLTKGALEEWMTDVEVFALMVAAIIHDFKHPGVNNNFLVCSKDDLAILYNDHSVLENHHLASAFTELNKPHQNILAALAPEQQVEVRKLIIDLVLVTDMAEHFEFESKFKTCVLGPSFDLEKPECRLAIMQMTLKCADVNSAAKPTHLALKWTDRVMEEFFTQGDKEKALGLPVSPMCERQGASVPKAQIRFIDFIVQPLYELYAEYLPLMEEYLQRLDVNRQHWQAALDKEVSAAAAV